MTADTWLGDVHGMVRFFPRLLVAALASSGLASSALARSFTLDAPAAVELPWTATPEVSLRAGPVAPARVGAELVGFAIELSPTAEGGWAGAFDLAPVPLPPGDYTVRFEAEDAAGEVTPFNQRLRLGVPAGGGTPWLPGDRPTGGPRDIELLTPSPLETGQAWGIQVRIPGQGRPDRFEALIAGYRAGFVNKGDYRYDARFAVPWLLPPATYTLRIEAEDADGALTVLEEALELTPPADGSTPWLSPVAATVWEAEPLDLARTVGGEPSGGCEGGRGAQLPWALGLALLLAACARGRRARAALLVAAASVAGGCGGGAETRAVGRGEALVQVVDAGEGFTNQAPLWPLALGHRRVLASLSDEGASVSPHTGELWVTESWPLEGGGRGMVLRPSSRDSAWFELALTADGLYATGSASAGRLHRPLLVLPAEVRVGMTWRSWARPADADRLDLDPAELIDDSGGFEFRVLRVTEDAAASTPRGRARVWEIAWKGPLPPHATFDWILELAGTPRTPARGVMRFVEGYGPTTPSYLPTLAYRDYGPTEGLDPGLSDAHLLMPAPSADAATGPEVTLHEVARPERIDGQSVHQISAIDLDDGHGVWLRFDGNAAGLGYPAAFPGSGGGGGNANLWVASARSECFAFEGERLVSGQELGVLGDDETCVHAAGVLVPPGGDQAFEVPFMGYYGAPISKKVLEGCDNHPGCFISTWPHAVLPSGDASGASLLAWHNQSPASWYLTPWRSFAWAERHQLNDLELSAEIDGAVLDGLLADLGLSQLVARSLGDGAYGLLARSATRYGDPTSFGFARLDPDGVIRDAVSYGPIGWGTSFRSDASGAEIWQVDRGGRVWEWRYTAAGMERRVRARLSLAGDETPTAAVRLDAERLFVVTAGPAPDNVPPLTPRLECSPAYCFNAPSPAPPRLWTATLPSEASASPWEPPPAVLGLEPRGDGSGVCVPAARGETPALVAPPAGVEAVVEEGGRCLSLRAGRAGAAPVTEWEARLPGTAPVRVVPMWPVP
ncbi:MAG: hypothetical protein R3F39_16110 [Myxococcota bacterium]